MIVLAFSHPSDDLTTITEVAVLIASVLWIALALMGRGRS